MKLKKGKQTFEVNSDLQAAAFKAAGWEEVKPRATRAKAVDPTEEAAEEAAE